jgi:hypothetical protein
LALHYDAAGGGEHPGSRIHEVAHHHEQRCGGAERGNRPLSCSMWRRAGVPRTGVP